MFEESYPRIPGGRPERQAFIAGPDPVQDDGHVGVIALELDGDVITCLRDGVVVWQCHHSRARFWEPEGAAGEPSAQVDTDAAQVEALGARPARVYGEGCTVGDPLAAYPSIKAWLPDRDPPPELADAPADAGSPAEVVGAASEYQAEQAEQSVQSVQSEPPQAEPSQPAPTKLSRRERRRRR